jgi:hypothetical protein
LGLLVGGGGLLLFARLPVDGSFMVDVLPGMLLQGIGAGMALNPCLLAVMSEVDAGDSGVASGMVNTAFMMGGALGLALLASVAAARTQGLMAQDVAEAAALNGGYQLAFLVAGSISVAAAALAMLLRKEGAPQASSVSI